MDATHKINPADLASLEQPIVFEAFEPWMIGRLVRRQR